MSGRVKNPRRDEEVDSQEASKERGGGGEGREQPPFDCPRPCSVGWRLLACLVAFEHVWAS